MSNIQRPPWHARFQLVRARLLVGGGLFVAAAAMPVASAHAALGGFEQVTPVSKSGGNVSGADTFRASVDGDRLLYTSSAPFAGAPVDSSPLYVRYIGEKVDGSWRTKATDPPFDPVPPAYISYTMGTIGSSENLAYVMVASTRALTPGAIEGGSNLYLRSTDTGQFALVAANPDIATVSELVGPSLSAVNVSYVAPDGTEAMFSAREPLTPDAPVDGSYVLYGWTASGGLYVISRLPADEGGAFVGGATSGTTSNGRRTLATRNALARVYFQAQIGGTGTGAYLRQGDSSVAVSRSEVSGDVEGARIQASSEDGEYALIETLVGGAPLTSDTPVDPAQDQPTYLYRYTRTSGDLEYVGTINPNGFPAGQVQQMSKDGRTIVFQSGFELAAGSVAGSANTFVWRDGDLRFVTSSSWPSGAASSATFLRLLSQNGRYLAFTDNDAVTFARAGADSGGAACFNPTVFSNGLCDEVFLYDTESDELTCASCRPAGVAQRGASGDPGSGDLGWVRMDQHQPQNVSNDGTVWFTSENDLLSTDDANGLPDVYQSRGGQLRLVSRARQGMSSRFLDATADGGVVFIATNDAIARTDNDEEVDIYATGPRIAVQPEIVPVAPLGECVGSDCRAPTVRPNVLQSPPGSQQDLGKRVEGKKGERADVDVVRVQWAKGRVRVSVRVSGDGRIRVSGKDISSSTRTVNRAGTYVIRARMSKSTRAKMRRNGRASLRLRASFSPPFDRAAVTKIRKVVR